MLKVIAVVLISLAVLGIDQVVAADMGIPAPTRVYPGVPPLRAVFSWTGCYVGAIVGGGWIDNQFTGGPFADTAVPFTLPGAATTAPLSNTSINVGSAGVLAGGQVGCDVQFNSPIVVGVAADGNWANLSGSDDENVSTTLFGTAPNAGVPTQFSSTGTLHEKTNFLSTVTGRIGYAWAQGLFYAKGGVAFDRNTYSFNGNATTTTCAAFAGGVCGTFNPPTTQSFNFTTGTDSRTGWTAGAGMEWAFSPNFSLQAEYNFVDFGTKNVTFTGGAGFPTTTYSNRQFINELKLGINARFSVY